MTMFLILTSCDPKVSHDVDLENISNSEALFVETLQKHLDAVSNKDLETLTSTMAPTGKMQLILPQEEIMYKAENFLKYHEDWFQDTTWEFETEVLDYDIDERLGTATTQIIYREPEREGKPYFNRMIVTYVLEKIEGKWYIVSDHASSIEKSTD